MKENTLAGIVKKAKKIVFFGGAGVSKGSGIPDFRGTGGLYTADCAESPEEILSGTYLKRFPEKFYSYYRKNMLYPNAKPNAAHLTLAKWEREGKLTSVITQNIDGLHQKAGSKRVYELHGTTLKNYCYRCGKSFDIDFIDGYDGVPYCPCGGIVKPDVVLYGEQLNGKTLQGAIDAIAEADLLIVGGTSLTVYPAAGLIDYFEGDALVLINRDATPFDDRADLVIREPVGRTLESVVFE